MSDRRLVAGYERSAAFNALAPILNGNAPPRRRAPVADLTDAILGAKKAAPDVDGEDDTSTSDSFTMPPLTPFSGYDPATDALNKRLWALEKKEERLAFFSTLNKTEIANLMAPANLAVFETKVRNYMIPLDQANALECLEQLKRCDGNYLNMLNAYRTYCDAARARIHSARRKRNSNRATEFVVTRREPPKIGTKMAAKIDAVSHVFGTDGLRRFVAAAVDAAEELVDPSNAALLHPLVELAHLVLVLGRGFIVDQALGLAPNTPSVADRETAAEIGALASQRGTALLAACADTTARLAVSQRPPEWLARVVPFQQLLAQRSVLALSFGRCGVEQRNVGGRASTQIVNTQASALLSPTAHARAGYWRALSNAARKLKIVTHDVSSEAPSADVATLAIELPRHALLRDSLTEPRDLEKLRTAFATQPAVEDAKRDLVDVTALATAAIANGDHHNAKETMSSSRSRKRPAPAAVEAAAATTLTAMATVPMRRRGVNGQLLVAHRDVVVQNISYELGVYCGKGAALLPNSCTAAALEILNKAYVSFPEYDLSIGVQGTKRVRLADKNKTGKMPAEFGNVNRMAIVMSHLGDVDVTGGYARLNDKTEPLSHYECFVLAARHWAECYISGSTQTLSDTDATVVGEMRQYELLYGHLLTQIGLRLHPELGTNAILSGDYEPPSVNSEDAARLHGVAVSASAADPNGDAIVLGVNELPAQFQFVASPLLVRLLRHILERYYRHIKIIDTRTAQFIPDAARLLPPLHSAARFPTEQRELAEYLTPDALQRGHSPETKRIFYDTLLPLIRVLFQVTCYNRGCKD